MIGLDRVVGVLLGDIGRVDQLCGHSASRSWPFWLYPIGFAVGLAFWIIIRMLGQIMKVSNLASLRH
jgi:hypothetical protein